VTASRVLVVGDITDDIIVVPQTLVTLGSDTAARITHRAGGSAANVAAWLARTGTPTTFVGRVGVANAAWHSGQLERAGVRVGLAVDRDVTTGTVVLVIDEAGERTMYVDRAANSRLEVADVEQAIAPDLGWLHLTGYSFFDPRVRPVAGLLMEQARRRGVPVSVDPSSTAFLRQVQPARFLTWAAGAAVVLPNLAEAQVLTGRTDPERTARLLADRFPVAVVKLGADGAVAVGPDGAPRRAVAVPTDLVDTAGAGDAFAAGFIGSWIVHHDLDAALEAGTRTGAQAVAKLGARPLDPG
jgi:sugar/nucleoside kinase (ribokinase family)